MKIIVRKSDYVVIASYDDSERVILDGEKLITTAVVGYGANKGNTIIYNVDALPDGFVVGKFFYNGVSFSLNPDYETDEQIITRKKSAYARGSQSKAKKYDAWLADHQ